MNVTATLFGQMITFAVLIWFVNRVLWEPLTKAMAERTKRIQDGLDAAEHGRKQEALAEAHAKKVIKSAKDESSEIIAHAKERAIEIVEHAKRDAKDETQRILAGTRAEIEREMNQAKEQLRKELGGLVVHGAGQVLGREIAATEHDALIDDLAARL